MNGPLEWVPDVELKKEVVSDESTEYEEYQTDLRQDTMPHVKSEFGHKQPVVFLEKLDLTLFNNGTGYTGDQQNSPVPFQEPHVDYQEEPGVDFRDNRAESAPLERKYVTSSLLSRIKVEEAEEDENPLTELDSKSAILRLVLKQELDVGLSTNEPSNSRPEINHQDETVTGKSKEDGTHQIISGRNSNRRKNPVVLLERLDPVFVRYHLKTSDSASSSSRSAPSLFQVKTGGRSGVNHGSVHNHIPDDEGIYRMTDGSRMDHSSVHKPLPENQGINRLSTNISKLSSQKEQEESIMNASETLTLTKDTEEPHLTTLEKSDSRSSSNPPNNTNTTLRKSSRLKKSRESLSGHVIHRHSDDRTLACAHCSLQFKGKKKLRRHIATVHNDERPFSCNQCIRKFSLKYILKKHVLIVHSKDRPFTCGQCSKSFKSKGDLTRHLMCAHSTDRPFSCDQCSQKFSLKCVLKNHVSKVHCEERLFSCGQCSKAFKSKDDLRMHLKCVHSADRPFSCDQCSRKFTMKCSLKTHVSTVHSEDRPFSCGQCSKSFKSKSDLRRHLMCVHIANRPFSCDQCSRTFSLKCYLNTHVLTVHK